MPTIDSLVKEFLAQKKLAVADAGDDAHATAIRSWAAGLPAAFEFEALQVDRLAQLQVAGGSR